MYLLRCDLFLSVEADYFKHRQAIIYMDFGSCAINGNL
jgi:hypothetical protein